MRKKWWILLWTIAMLAFAGCEKSGEVPTTESTAATEAAVAENSATEAGQTTDAVATISAEELQGDVQIIDTREEAQYIGWKNEQGNGGHIPNATDFPLSWFAIETNQEHIDIELERRGLKKDAKTVLYGDDTLTGDVVQPYVDAGFTDVSVLEGGLDRYVETNDNLESLKGYSMYVSPQWVQDVMDGKEVEHAPKGNVVIAEVDFAKMEAYNAGHIQGAVYVNTDQLNHVPGPREVAEYENIPIETQRTIWNRPDKEVIQETLENLGIRNDTTVILYATYTATTAANRAALIMDYAGVQDIRLLNGGKELWQHEGRALVQDVPTTEIVEFGAEVPANPGIVFDYEEERAMVDDPNAVIASVRSWDEYLGNKSGYTYIAEAGDIENSRFAYAGSDPYAMEDFRNIDNTMFNYKMVEQRWADWGITSDKKVSFHCGTGWRASETYYIAKALGWENIGVYDGGWFEWTKYPDSPVMEKGLPADAPEQTPRQFFIGK